MNEHSKGVILSQFWSIFNEFHILKHHAAPLPDDETRPNLVSERGKTWGYCIPILVMIGLILWALEAFATKNMLKFGIFFNRLTYFGRSSGTLSIAWMGWNFQGMPSSWCHYFVRTLKNFELCFHKKTSYFFSIMRVKIYQNYKCALWQHGYTPIYKILQ